MNEKNEPHTSASELRREHARNTNFHTALLVSLCVMVEVFALSGGFLLGREMASRIDTSAISPSNKQTANQVVTAALWGIDFSEVKTKNEGDGALSTTPIEALTVALATAEQDEQYAQNLYVCNHDDTDYLCVGATTWADTCGAGDMTCRSTAGINGLVVKPATCRSMRFLGNERPCIQGSGAISAYDVERITYRGTEY